MPILSVISAVGCWGEQIVNTLSYKLNFEIITDDMIINEAAKSFKLSPKKIKKIIFAHSTLFSPSHIEFKKSISKLKITLLRKALNDNFIYYGYGTLLMPKTASHILKVCIGAIKETRIKNISSQNSISYNKAEKIIKESDKSLYRWSQLITNKSPADASLYDMVLSIIAQNIDEIIEQIFKILSSEKLIKTHESMDCIQDEILSESVKLKLLQHNHDVDVEAINGNIKLYIKKYKLWMGNYIQKIKNLTETIDGVKNVETTFGKDIEIPSPIANLKFEKREKVLLVDDEIEFVDALSERLSTRNFTTSVAYSGEEALENISKIQPDVMILDLKMPGIDGIEVLRKVKAEHPETEVIILTGHGSDIEKRIALELGAFAYLEKPVDINVLSETMKKAYSKIDLSKTDSNSK